MYDTDGRVLTGDREVRSPVMPHRSHAPRTVQPLTLLAAIVLAALVVASSASAVSTVGRVTVTATPAIVATPATYVIGMTRTEKDEWITGYTVTFPAGTDVSHAVAGSGDTTSSPDGRTLTVTFATANRIPPRTNSITLTLTGVVNPSLAGTYQITGVTFHTLVGGAPVDDVVVFTKGQGAYTITPPPYLTMTIATQDGTQTLDFGAVEPGVTSAAKTVSVTVDSGSIYDLTRQVVDVEGPIGLGVSGNAQGTGLPAGTPTTFTDSYTVTPPWTTAPEVPLNALVTYTVVQY